VGQFSVGANINAPLNLIELMPHLSELRVFDNSADATRGEAVPDPVLLLHVHAGTVEFPVALSDLARTPDWAKPIVKAARDLEHK